MKDKVQKEREKGIPPEKGHVLDLGSRLLVSQKLRGASIIIRNRTWKQYWASLGSILFGFELDLSTE